MTDSAVSSASLGRTHAAGSMEIRDSGFAWLAIAAQERVLELANDKTRMMKRP